MTATLQPVLPHEAEMVAELMVGLGIAQAGDVMGANGPERRWSLSDADVLRLAQTCVQQVQAGTVESPRVWTPGSVQ